MVEGILDLIGITVREIGLGEGPFVRTHVKALAYSNIFNTPGTQILVKRGMGKHKGHIENTAHIPAANVLVEVILSSSLFQPKSPGCFSRLCILLRPQGFCNRPLGGTKTDSAI